MNKAQAKKNLGVLSAFARAQGRKQQPNAAIHPQHGPLVQHGPMGAQHNGEEHQASLLDENERTAYLVIDGQQRLQITITLS
jgi:hypothetical protein